MDITLHDVPIELYKALIVRATSEKRSVAKTILDATARDLGVALPEQATTGPAQKEPLKYRDLSDIAGTWVEDPEFDAIIDEQNRIDPELWH